MENKKLMSISIIILAVSILFGSVFIGYSLLKINKTLVSNIQVSEEKALLTEEEAAKYLNISVEELKKILLNDAQENIGMIAYPVYKFMPYLEPVRGKKLFNKSELDEWVKYNMHNK